MQGIINCFGTLKIEEMPGKNVKHLRVSSSGAGHSGDLNFNALGAKPWHYVAELLLQSWII